MYPYKNNNIMYLHGNDDRQFFIPFVLGGLLGGGLVGLSRPRPYYNNNVPYNPYFPAANTSYSYYVPTNNPY